MKKQRLSPTDKNQGLKRLKTKFIASLWINLSGRFLKLSLEVYLVTKKGLHLLVENIFIFPKQPSFYPGEVLPYNDVFLHLIELQCLNGFM